MGIVKIKLVFILTISPKLDPVIIFKEVMIFDQGVAIRAMNAILVTKFTILRFANI